MAKTTLTIDIEVTAPNAGETDWLVVVGRGGVEQFPGPHEAKGRLQALGLAEADTVAVLTDAITEALGGRLAARKPQNAPNPNRVAEDGLRGRQRTVLKTLARRGDWNRRQPTWALRHMPPSEIERVLVTLQSRGFVQGVNDIWSLTTRGREYVSQPDPAVVAISPRTAS